MREQAERVAAWIELGTQHYGPKEISSTMHLVASNATDLPVYQFRVDIRITLDLDKLSRTSPSEAAAPSDSGHMRTKQPTPSSSSSPKPRTSSSL